MSETAILVPAAASRVTPHAAVDGRLLTLLLVVCAALIVWFAGSEYRSLTEPDEGRYAEVAREMLVSGDWVVPRSNGFKFYDKPVLHYWATATAFKAFGVHNWTARLWSLLTGLLAIAAVGYGGLRVFGRREGISAALVFGSSFLCVVGSHVNSLDMGLTAFLAVLLSAFLIAQQDTASPSTRRRWMLVAWLAMALAVLSKGVIAIVLPGAILAGYMLWQRDWRLVRRLHLVAGLAVLLAVCLPWFIAIGLADENFYRFFFVHEHLQRFLSKTHDRYQPWWFFLPVVVFGMLPWTLFLPAALRRRSLTEVGRFRPGRLLVLWFAAFLLFFSLSSSKLVFYILPALPALALLVGVALARMDATALIARLQPVALLAVLAVLGLGLLYQPAANSELSAAHLAFAHGAAVATALLAAALGLAIALCRRQQLLAGLASAAFGGLLCTQGVMLGFQRLEPGNSAASMAALAAPHLAADTPVYSVRFYFRGLPFYLQRLVTVAYDTPTDLVAGMAWQPELQLADLDAFTRAWRAHPGAVAFVRPDVYQELRERHVEMQLIADRQPVVMLVQSPAPPAAADAPPAPEDAALPALAIDPGLSSDALRDVASAHGAQH